MNQHGNLPGGLILLTCFVAALFVAEPKDAAAQAAQSAAASAEGPVPTRTVDPVESLNRAQARVAPLAGRAANANLRTDLLYKGPEKALLESGISLRDQTEQLPEARREFLDAIGAVRNVLRAARARDAQPDADQAGYDLQSYSDQTLQVFSELDLNIAEIRNASDPDAIYELFILNKSRLKRLKNLLDRGPELISATLAAAGSPVPSAKTPQAKAGTAKGPAAAPGTGPENVRGDIDTVLPPGEAAAHLERAGEAIRSGNHDQAAEQLRLATGLIKLHEDQSGPAQRLQLNDSVYELLWLANRSERKHDVTAAESQAVLARACLALGNHYLARAEQALAAQSYNPAGDALDAARQYALQGREMLDGKGRGSAARAFRSIARSISIGPNWSANEVESTREKARTDLENLEALIRMRSDGR